MAAIISQPLHLDGPTRVCFSPDGSTIFTGGTDCLVRIHSASDPDSEPGFHADHTDAVTSLSCSSAHLVTASLDNIARSFSYPQNELEGFVTRSAGVPIRWVSVDKQGERVAVCSDDLLVKIVHVNDTTRVQLLSDNTKSVRSASWDPTGKYLVTASCDGKLKIYDTSGSEPALVKIMEGIIGPTEVDGPSCYVAWHPDGGSFAVPLRTKEVGVFSKNGWTKVAAYSGHSTVVSELAWSPNGRYLAASAGPSILIWSTSDRSVVARHTNDPKGAVSGLAFSPTSNLLAFTGLDGSFSRWTDPIPSNLPSPITSETIQAKDLDKLLDDEFGDEDMEEKGEDLFGDDDGLDAVGDDWIVDDDGTFAEDDGERRRGGRTEVVNVTKSQPPFIPGSTMMRAKKRYLAFDMIGSVDITDQETHHVVNVEFHDKSARRGYHFQDHHKYSLASLGEHGAVYACTSTASSEGSSTSGGQVYYRPYDSWASASDWSVSLLQGEEPVLVAAGGTADAGCVIVGTSRGDVRFFTASGVQTYLWRVGDEMVCMAAARDSVLLVHREGGTSLDGCQNLRYSLMSLDTFDIQQEGRLPLPRKTTLSWLGFTAEGSPAMYDSSGLLSILDRFRRPGQARWVPLVDTNLLERKQGRKERYWVVGVREKSLGCVILKGAETEPWFPRPLVHEIDVHMPVLNFDTQQGKLEESTIRNTLSLSLLRDEPTANSVDVRGKEVAIDKELLQLVQAACKADNLARALDLARMMHSPATVEAAAKVAAFYHLPGLQERIVSWKVEMERRKRRAGAERSGGDSSRSGERGQREAAVLDFAPRERARRNFGGVQHASNGLSGREETPVSTMGGSVVPETPGGAEETPAPESQSPPAAEKRKRPEHDEVEEFAVPAKPAKRADDIAFGSKNPFHKKPVASNPFAKAAVARPLDAIKSTSFFDRVDTIESSGASRPAASAGARGGKKKQENVKPEKGKQQTLFGMKGVNKRPEMVDHQSEESVRTEVDDASEMEDRGVLEETQIQETLESEESMDVA